jgi:hypothetical protein
LSSPAVCIIRIERCTVCHPGLIAGFRRRSGARNDGAAPCEIPGGLEGYAVVYLHEDHSVTGSLFHGEDVLGDGREAEQCGCRDLQLASAKRG